MSHPSALNIPGFGPITRLGNSDMFCFVIDTEHVMLFLFKNGDVYDLAIWPNLYGNNINEHLFDNQHPNFYSCYLSYSSADRIFAHRLHEFLTNKQIKCWLDEQEMRPGDDLYDVIFKNIEASDKLLLCCSKSSLSSWWVKSEITTAFEKEQKLSKEGNNQVCVLIPLDLDGFIFSDEWKSAMASRIRGRVVADFTGWQSDEIRFISTSEALVKALEVATG
jgi:TIR domain